MVCIGRVLSACATLPCAGQSASTTHRPRWVHRAPPRHGMPSGRRDQKPQLAAQQPEGLLLQAAAHGMSAVRWCTPPAVLTSSAWEPCRLQRGEKVEVGCQRLRTGRSRALQLVGKRHVHHRFYLRVRFAARCQWHRLRRQADQDLERPAPVDGMLGDVVQIDAGFEAL